MLWLWRRCRDDLVELHNLQRLVRQDLKPISKFLQCTQASAGHDALQCAIDIPLNLCDLAAFRFEEI